MKKKLTQQDYKNSYVNLYNDLITFLNEAEENKLSAWVKFGSILSVLKTVIEDIDDDQDEDICPDCSDNDVSNDVDEKFKKYVHALEEFTKAVKK